jgi:hypothetical protein
VLPTAADAQQKKQEAPLLHIRTLRQQNFPQGEKLDERPLSENRPACSTQRLNEKSFRNPGFFLQETQLFRNCCTLQEKLDLDVYLA